MVNEEKIELEVNEHGFSIWDIFKRHSDPEEVSNLDEEENVQDVAEEV